MQFDDMYDESGDRQSVRRANRGCPPILRCITIRLRSDAFRYDLDARQEIAMSALAAALLSVDDNVPPAWRICPLMNQAPLSYDMLPLPGYRVTCQAAWDLTAALRAQPQIAAADPAFEIEERR